MHNDTFDVGLPLLQLADVVDFFALFLFGFVVVVEVFRRLPFAYDTRETCKRPIRF